MKGFFILVTFFVFAALSPAPVYSNSAPHGITPEQSQAQRETEQSYQRTQEVVGSVPQVTTQGIALHSGGDGADLVRGANREVERAASNGSAQPLEVAQVDVQRSGRSPLRTLFTLVLVCGFCYGAFAGFRKWADNHLPSPKPRVPTRW